MRPLGFAFHAWLQSHSPVPGTDPSTVFWQPSGSLHHDVPAGRRAHRAIFGSLSRRVRGVSSPTALGSTVDVLSSEPEDYGDPAYWDEFYTKEPRPYDWFMDYEDIQKYIQRTTKGDKDARILHVGCGNSELPEFMHEEGYTNIANIDISAVVIDYMADRNRDKKGLTWTVMDATKMKFADGKFDVVIDKSLIDTLECTEEAYELEFAYLSEVFRVLRPGGGFLCFTLCDSEYMKPLFDEVFFPAEIREWSFPIDPDDADPQILHTYILVKPDATAPAGN